jgi:hypothetical protein
MLVGLHVETVDGEGATLWTKIGWTVPPPDGAAWSCCRRTDYATAEVVGVEWAGLDGDADVWVILKGDARLVGHLIDKHDFSPLQR